MRAAWWVRPAGSAPRSAVPAADGHPGARNGALLPAAGAGSQAEASGRVVAPAGQHVRSHDLQFPAGGGGSSASSSGMAALMLVGREVVPGLVEVEVAVPRLSPASW